MSHAALPVVVSIPNLVLLSGTMFLVDWPDTDCQFELFGIVCLVSANSKPHHLKMGQRPSCGIDGSHPQCAKRALMVHLLHWWDYFNEPVVHPPRTYHLDCAVVFLQVSLFCSISQKAASQGMLGWQERTVHSGFRMVSDSQTEGGSRLADGSW